MKAFALLARERGQFVRVSSILCSALLISHAARAHTLPISELRLVPDKNYLHLDLALNPSELTFFSELDANRNGALDLREWRGQGERIARRILESLTLSVNGRRVTAEIVGLLQTYESHHIFVRAHFPVDARGASVLLESGLTELTSGSHVTQVTCGSGEFVQEARLDTQSNKATFQPFEASSALTSAAMTSSAGLVNDFTALQANERAVIALLGLLFLAALPPGVFFVLSPRFAMNHDQLGHASVH